MLNYFSKINNNILYSIILYFCFCLMLFILPWNRPDEIKTFKQTGTMTATLQTYGSDKSNLYEIDLATIEQPFWIFRQVIKSIQFSDPENYFTLNKGQESRWSKNVILTILVSSFLFTFLCLYFIDLIEKALAFKRPLIILPVLLIHLSVLSIFFLRVHPGYYSIDSFAYLYNSALIEFSEFTGFYYSAFLNAIIHLFPYPATLGIFQLILIFLFLFHLLLLSLEFKVQNLYIIFCIIFYLNPVNVIMSMDISRDAISHWIFTIFLLETWKIFTANTFLKQERMNLLCWAIFSSLFRPGIIYILLVFFGFLYFCKSRWQKNWSLTFALVLLFFKFLPDVALDRGMALRHYQTTALINPLSYILRQLYPKGLPQEVKNKLGNYFQNDNLINYVSEVDIDPYHNNGLNYEANEKDYLQFRNEAFSLFIHHPDLFLKNRIRLDLAMFGLTEDHLYLGSDKYNENNPFHNKVKMMMGFENVLQRRFADYLADPFKLMENHSGLSSYLFPLLILGLSLLISIPGGWFQKVCLILLSRTIFTLIFSPAAYFKYNYCIWIFSIFSFPFVVVELKTRLKNRRSTNGTPI